MVRLHIGDCHVRVLIDRHCTKNHNLEELYSHIDKRNTLRIMENNLPRIAPHLLLPSLQWTGKITILSITGCRLTKNTFSRFGENVEPLLISSPSHGQGLDSLHVRGSNKPRPKTAGTS